MAVGTKTIASMQASTSVAAGGSQTSTTLSLTTSLGASVVARVVNGATAPTIGCDVILEYQDGTNWFESARATAGLTNAATYDLVFAIRPEIQNVRLRFTGHTGQAVTVEAHAHVLSSVA